MDAYKKVTRKLKRKFIRNHRKCQVDLNKKFFIGVDKGNLSEIKENF